MIGRSVRPFSGGRRDIEHRKTGKLDCEKARKTVLRHGDDHVAVRSNLHSTASQEFLFISSRLLPTRAFGNDVA